jgi:hypothetical protein
MTRDRTAVERAVDDGHFFDARQYTFISPDAPWVQP